MAYVPPHSGKDGVPQAGAKSGVKQETSEPHTGKTSRDADELANCRHKASEEGAYCPVLVEVALVTVVHVGEAGLAALAPVWGYAFIFAFMAIESSFIPFPSEIVMIPAGFLAARGELTLHAPVPDLALACAVGLAGSLAGAYFNYFLSSKLGEPFLRKYGKWFFVKPAALDRACEVFNRYGGVTTFVCRLVPVIRQLISIPAGLARMPLATFTLFTGLGAGIWTIILAAVGYALGRSAGDITYLELVHRGKALLDANLVWILLGAAVLAVAYVAVSKLVMRRRPDHS